MIEEAQHFYEVEGWSEDMLRDYYGREIDVTGWTQRVGGSVEAHVVAETHKHEVSSLRFKVSQMVSEIDELAIENKIPLAKVLVDSMTKLVELERRVYGIKDEASGGTLAQALKELAHAIE